jgi:hypothetical protein
MVLWIQTRLFHQIAREYETKLAFDVLSGGMIMPEQPTHVAPMARYIQTAL